MFLFCFSKKRKKKFEVLFLRLEDGTEALETQRSSKIFDGGSTVYENKRFCTELWNNVMLYAGTTKVEEERAGNKA
jgi:hypothetical protein